MKTGKQFPAPPPEREVGDQVEINATDGAITATSHGKSMVIRKKNLIGPTLSVTYTESAGQVGYVYNLSNAPGSVHAVGGFALYLSAPGSVEVIAPAPWKSVAILHPARPETPALLILPVKPDSDKLNRLSAGKQVGPIRMKAAALPGLVRVVFQPEVEPPTPGELTEGDFFNLASAWTRQRILDLDTNDRREARGWTIGPKTSSTTDTITAIQVELREGQQVLEFAPILPDLQAAVSLSSAGAIADRLVKVGKTPLQQQFVEAVRWRLARIR